VLEILHPYHDVQLPAVDGRTLATGEEQQRGQMGEEASTTPGAAESVIRRGPNGTFILGCVEPVVRAPLVGGENRGASMVEGNAEGSRKRSDVLECSPPAFPPALF
jgi:hypothetical protein